MGIYHAMILVDLVALSLGVGIIFVALLSWERSGVRWLRDLAMVLVGVTVLLMLDIFRLYEVTAGWPQGLAGRVVLAVLSGAGNLVMVIAVPLFVEGVTSFPPNRTLSTLHLILLVLIPLAGMLDEAFDVAAFHTVNDLGIGGLLAGAAVVLAIGYRRVTEPETRRMINRLMWVTAVNFVLGRSQLVITGILGVALELRRVRMVQVLYYLVVLAIVLVYAVRHLFRPSGTADPLPSQDFVKRYGISNRERDIIAMIVQGHANRVIGERLFISDRTVKNHISSIYRKTSVANKVQLLNMVRNHPGSQGAVSAPGGKASTSASRTRL